MLHLFHALRIGTNDLAYQTLHAASEYVRQEIKTRVAGSMHQSLPSATTIFLLLAYSSLTVSTP
jgi:hypothetical protein